jgi:hypothetical protein
VRLKFEPAAADAYENIADDEVLNRLDMVFGELEKIPARRGCAGTGGLTHRSGESQSAAGARTCWCCGRPKPMATRR